MQQIKRLKKYSIVEPGQSSPHGDHIYEWEFLDSEGNLKKDKKNVFEEIQSYLPRVDYKAQIERGELDPSDIRPTHTDFTGIPNDTVALYDYLNTLANLPQEQVAKLLEQVNAGNQKGVQGEQTTDSKATAGGQVTQKDVSGQSTDAKVDSDTSGQSKETGGSK